MGSGEAVPLLLRFTCSNKHKLPSLDRHKRSVPLAGPALKQPLWFSTQCIVGNVVPRSDFRSTNKLHRELQFPRDKETGLFPSRAVALWEGIGNLAAYVGEKSGWGKRGGGGRRVECGNPEPETRLPEGDLVGGRSREGRNGLTVR